MGNIDGDGKIQWQSKSSRSRSLSFGSESGEGIGAGQSSCGLGLGNALQNPKEDFASAVGVLRPPVRRMCGRAAHDHHSCPARVQWSCLLVRIVLQDALNEVTKICPPLKLRVFVYDITALLMVKNKVVAELAKKVMKKLKKEVERKGLKVSVTEDGKEGKSKMIVSCGFLESELSQFS